MKRRVIRSMFGFAFALLVVTAAADVGMAASAPPGKPASPTHDKGKAQAPVPASPPAVAPKPPEAPKPGSARAPSGPKAPTAVKPGTAPPKTGPSKPGTAPSKPAAAKPSTPTAKPAIGAPAKPTTGSKGGKGVPEFDPASSGAALSLLLGSVLVVFDRRPRKTGTV
jgi:hypothetical protein